MECSMRILTGVSNWVPFCRTQLYPCQQQTIASRVSQESGVCLHHHSSVQSFVLNVRRKLGIRQTCEHIACCLHDFRCAFNNLHISCMNHVRPIDNLIMYFTSNVHNWRSCNSVMLIFCILRNCTLAVFSLVHLFLRFNVYVTHKYITFVGKYLISFFLSILMYNIFCFIIASYGCYAVTYARISDMMTNSILQKNHLHIHLRGE